MNPIVGIRQSYAREPDERECQVINVARPCGTVGSSRRDLYNQLRAARHRHAVIWDLWHYDWPDDIDSFSCEFIDRFRAFALQAITVIGECTDRPMVSPINEISFLAWAGGEAGIFNPFATHRGDEIKRQLVRVDRGDRCDARVEPGAHPRTGRSDPRA